jgi:hypothetical protein
MNEAQMASHLRPLSAFINTYWRGDRDALRSSLISFSEEMDSQNISSVSQIRNKLLRGLLSDITRDPQIMRNLETAFPQTSEIERIVLALTKILTL